MGSQGESPSRPAAVTQIQARFGKRPSLGHKPLGLLFTRAQVAEVPPSSRDHVATVDR